MLASRRLICILLPAVLLARSVPLWPGAPYTTAERDRAIERGIHFIYRMASDPKIFADMGHDLLWCFYEISSTAKNPKLRQTARAMGHERALEWRRTHLTVPRDVSADDLSNLVFGSGAAERLGVPDPQIKVKLREAAARYSAVDFLRFDPTREPPLGENRYDIWTDALITTYSGDLYGITLGAPYRDVIRWIRVMRPYPQRAGLTNERFFEVTYAITHVIYTLNDYGMRRLSPSWLPQEYEYLKANLEEAIKLEDPETVGEFLDTLRAFGMTEADPLIRTGVAYVLSKQNPDGSWGDVDDASAYNRYHSTWTAVDGLRQYAFKKPEAPPAALDIEVSYPHALRAQSFHPRSP